MFFSFKAHYNSALNAAVIKKSGTPVTIYDVAACVGIAHSRGMTPENVMSGFKKSGLFPYDPDVFSHFDFLPNEVTRRLPPAPPTDLDKDIQEQEQENRVPKTLEKQKMSDNAVVTLEDIRHFPKAQERRPAASKRRRVRSVIITDTPEKMANEEIRKNRNPQGKNMNKRPLKKKVRETVTDSECDEFQSEDHRSSDEDVDWASSDPVPPMNFNGDPVKGDFVLVKFITE